MKNHDKSNIDSMSIEELRIYAHQLESKAESETKRADEAILALEKLLAEFPDRKNIIRRYNMERFFSKADNAYERETAKEADPERKSRKGVAGRPVGSRNFGMSPEDLEKLSEGNEPIVYDAVEDLPEDQRDGFVKVSETVGYQIEIQQKKVIVRKAINIVRKNEGGTGTEFLREPSHLPVKGCIAAPSLLADVVFMKYGFGVPHYRYVNWLSGRPLPVTPQLLYGWTAGACDAMLPVYDGIKERFRLADVVHIDETPVRTLDAEGRINGYVFVFSAAVEGRKIRLYVFSADRRTEIVREILGSDYRGLIVVDGYDGYDCFSSLGMGIQRCWVHACRKFKDILKGMPKKEQKGSEAEKVVSLFRKVFSDEETIRQIGPKTPEERLDLRNDPARVRHVDDLITELEKVKTEYAEGSLMKKAAEYFLRDKDAFLTFRKDGRAPIDNSEAERTVKPYALARRNFLFVRGRNGGDCSAIAMTMIQNAYINGIEPMSYIQLLLSDAWKGNGNDLPWDPEVQKRAGGMSGS